MPHQHLCVSLCGDLDSSDFCDSQARQHLQSTNTIIVLVCYSGQGQKHIAFTRHSEYTLVLIIAVHLNAHREPSSISSNMSIAIWQSKRLHTSRACHRVSKSQFKRRLAQQSGPHLAMTFYPPGVLPSSLLETNDFCILDLLLCVQNVSITNACGVGQSMTAPI